MSGVDTDCLTFSSSDFVRLEQKIKETMLLYKGINSVLIGLKEINEIIWEITILNNSSPHEWLRDEWINNMVAWL